MKSKFFSIILLTVIIGTLCTTKVNAINTVYDNNKKKLIDTVCENQKYGIQAFSFINNNHMIISQIDTNYGSSTYNTGTICLLNNNTYNVLDKAKRNNHTNGIAYDSRNKKILIVRGNGEIYVDVYELNNKKLIKKSSISGISGNAIGYYKGSQKKYDRYVLISEQVLKVYSSSNFYKGKDPIVKKTISFNIPVSKVNGNFVESVQKKLKNLGYLKKSYNITESYNATVNAAIKKFQKQKNLTVNGKVGAKTARALGLTVEVDDDYSNIVVQDACIHNNKVYYVVNFKKAIKLGNREYKNAVYLYTYSTDNVTLENVFLYKGNEEFESCSFKPDNYLYIMTNSHKLYKTNIKR